MTFQDIIMFLTYQYFLFSFLFYYIFYHKFYDLRKRN